MSLSKVPFRCLRRWVDGEERLEEEQGCRFNSCLFPLPPATSHEKSKGFAELQCYVYALHAIDDPLLLPFLLMLVFEHIFFVLSALFQNLYSHVLAYGPKATRIEYCIRGTSATEGEFFTPFSSGNLSDTHKKSHDRLADLRIPHRTNLIKICISTIGY